MGYLTHVAGHDRPAEVYRETVELAVAAEALGFASFWVAQHHGGAFGGLLPSPLVLLAAVAERTTTIRLGTAVIAAPLENPRRLAEDAAVLEVLSGGRLNLGIGAGADTRASAAFGRDHAARHGDCIDVVDTLCALLEGEELVPGATGLRRRLWWATGSSAGVDAAAARGIGVISGRPPDAPNSTVVDDLTRYWTCVVDDPRVAVSRLVHPGQRADQLAAAWSADPAMPWASELITQTQPVWAGLTTQLHVMRMLAGELAPALTVLSGSSLVLT
nr:LLM class flavin-dependent oxidoreductase [Pseudonocardia acidicola]